MALGILVFAHGSKDPLWRKPVEAVVTTIESLSPTTLVRSAFLEWTEPTLSIAAADLVSMGATQIRILPMFLGIGKHLREDLPSLMDDLRQAYPRVDIAVLPSVGENQQVTTLLARIALENNSIDE